MRDRFYWHRRAQKAIGQGSLTNSKRPESLVKGVYPTHAVSGKGCRIWDHEGNTYIDFIGGLGTNLFGYGEERIARAVETAIRQGVSLSISSTDEVETAEALKNLFPFCDRFKFLKSGSEACSAAIRMARAFTGRDVVLSAGYHGWHDEFTSLTPPANGVPNQYNIFDLEYGDIREAAAVILEPVITDYSKARRQYLEELRSLCTKHGTILIFDEVITGFRWPEYSVAGHWDINPDLICIGKAMANGMPLAAVGGRAEILDGDYFVSSTYAGDRASLAACRAVVRALNADIYNIGRLWESGHIFIDQFNDLFNGVKIEGYPSRGRIVGPDRDLFLQEACKAGLLFGPSWFWNFPLMEEKNIFTLLNPVAQKLNGGLAKMEGEPPQSPFAERARHGR